jgi:hypothetical protein
MGITEVITASAHLGRIPTSSVRSARFAANAWITSSSSTTCGVLSSYFQYHRDARTHLSLDKDCPRFAAYNFPPRATLLPSRRSAVCIIATSTPRTLSRERRLVPGFRGCGGEVHRGRTCWRTRDFIDACLIKAAVDKKKRVGGLFCPDCGQLRSGAANQLAFIPLASIRL